MSQLSSHLQRSYHYFQHVVNQAVIPFTLLHNNYYVSCVLHVLVCLFQVLDCLVYQLLIIPLLVRGVVLTTHWNVILLVDRTTMWMTMLVPARKLNYVISKTPMKWVWSETVSQREMERYVLLWYCHYDVFIAPPLLRSVVQCVPEVYQMIMCY